MRGVWALIGCVKHYSCAWSPFKLWWSKSVCLTYVQYAPPPPPSYVAILWRTTICVDFIAAEGHYWNAAEHISKVTFETQRFLDCLLCDKFLWLRSWKLTTDHIVQEGVNTKSFKYYYFLLNLQRGGDNCFLTLIFNDKTFNFSNSNRFRKKLNIG
jgi:hypothetical protein